jgi:hypothetical protein
MTTVSALSGLGAVTAAPQEGQKRLPVSNSLLQDPQRFMAI